MVFSEFGLMTLTEVFTDLGDTFGNKWDAVGPLNNREKICQNSINWFFKMLLKRLQREEEAQGPSWNLWIGTVSSDQVGEMLDAAQGLQRALGAVLEEHAGPILDHLSKVSEWLRAFQQVVYEEPEPELEPEQEDEEEEAEQQAPSVPGSDEAGLSVEGSYHLELLIKKMEAFERLIEQEKYSRAALVADDIQNIIANFDPTLYFPRLFASFTKLLAVNMAELAEYEEARETRDWQAMQAFYQVDLDGFVDLESEG
jgi:hypothetical protein